MAILKVWAAPGAREALQKGGELAPGDAQTPKTVHFRPLTQVISPGQGAANLDTSQTNRGVSVLYGFI